MSGWPPSRLFQRVSLLVGYAQALGRAGSAQVLSLSGCRSLRLLRALRGDCIEFGQSAQHRVSTPSVAAARAVVVICFTLLHGGPEWLLFGSRHRGRVWTRGPLCPCGFPPGRKHQSLPPPRERRGQPPCVRAGQVQGSVADPPTRGSLCSASASPDAPKGWMQPGSARIF